MGWSERHHSNLYRILLIFKGLIYFENQKDTGGDTRCELLRPFTLFQTLVF